MKIERTFDLLEHISKREKSSIALGQKKRGKWITYSVDEYISNTQFVSSALVHYGVKKGDKIASITNDRPEWNFIDLGIQMIGGVHIPIAFTSEEKVVKHILNETEARIVFISNRILFVRLKKILNALPYLEKIVSFVEIKDCESFSNFLQNGKDNFNLPHIESVRKTISPNDLGAILYTSGTSSEPKGVMLTHRNLCMVFSEFPKLFPTQKNSNALSVLPLSHIGARKINYISQYKGLPVYYADSNSNILEVMQKIKPGITAFVPFLLDKIHTQITRESQNKKGFHKWVLDYAYQQTQNYNPTQKSIFNSIKHSVLNQLIYKKWRMQVGGNLKTVICGGASVSEQLLKFYWTIGIPIYEVYGLTETTSLVSTNSPGNTKFGTVGKAYNNIEVTTNEQKEIICRGDNITKGYFKKPELTKKDIDKNGFFHTGDLGTIDDEGFIKITGRKKEIFKTASGDYVAPEVIENKLKQSIYISQILIYGANKEYLSALIIPDFESLASWAKTNNIDDTDGSSFINHKMVKKLITNEIKKFHVTVNESERIEHFKLLKDMWQVETGELSSLMKLKRNFILEKYAGTEQQ